MKNKSLILLLFLLTVPALEAISQTVYQLRSANFTLLLRNGKDGLQYKIGVEDQIKDHPLWYSFNYGTAEDKSLSSSDFIVNNIQESNQGDVSSIAYTLQHRLLPLEIYGTFTAYSQTGVIEQTRELRNTGTYYSLRFDEASSCDFSFLGTEYQYSCLTSGWGVERKLKTQSLNDDILFESKEGRSSAVYSPWLCLHRTDADVYYITSLAWSGNWKAKIKKNPATITMGEYFDNGWLRLMPGQIHRLPSVFISGGASMDEAANHLHHYQRDFLIPKQPEGLFMPAIFNPYFAIQTNFTANSLKNYINRAADLGFETFNVDVGWYGRGGDWNQELGSWETNRFKFPNGLGETATYARDRGMQFGLWFEMEMVSENSEILKEHPDWLLQFNGAPVFNWFRHNLDFSKPEVFQWVSERFDNIYRECNNINYLKLDCNPNIGCHFENEIGINVGDRLHRHLTSYYAWLDSLHVRYPAMFIENCSSGGLRLDMGIAAHAHTNAMTDQVKPTALLGMAWSMTLEYIPRAITHWAVGNDFDGIFDPTLPPGYWDFMFKACMGGQFGVSSRILDWSPELQQCAAKNIAIYKRIRTVIADADCYHLTPQPDYDDPTGWVAIQYVEPDKRQSVLMAYRTRGNQSSFTAKLQGLDPNREYNVFIDEVNIGAYAGSALMKSGLAISLPDEFTASVVEINEK
jgi:alpha-galactosidase